MPWQAETSRIRDGGRGSAVWAKVYASPEADSIRTLQCLMSHKPKTVHAACAQLPKSAKNKHNSALFTIVMRFENTTAQLVLLAFHQVQGS
jgi:hypothetical protein